MQIITKQELFDEKFIENIKNDFLLKVYENNNKSDNLFKYTKTNEPIFFYGKIAGKQNTISVSRKFLHKITKSTYNFKSYPSKAKIKSSLDDLIAKSDSSAYNILELKSADALGYSTQLRQDFTCFVIRYFFKSNHSDPFVFCEEFLQNEIAIDKKHLDIVSTLDDFYDFLYPNNFDYLLDSIASALTLKHNAKKLKLRNDLENYIIAEENAPKYGVKIKKDPYNIIKQNEKNYYSNPDKLIIADLFLYHTGGPDTSGDLKQQKYFEINKKSTLGHNEFVGYMNKAMVSGYIVPISLKKLTINDVNSKTISPKVKIVNIAELRSVDEKGYEKDLVDPFLMKIVNILKIENRSEFEEQLSKLIDIDEKSIKLNMYGTRSTFDFKAYFKGNRIGETYDVFIQVNQLSIKPPGSTSNSGLGGVSLEYIKDKIMKHYPNATFFERLKIHRDAAFGESFVVNLAEQDFFYNKSSKNEDLAKIIIKYRLLEKKYKTLQNYIKACLSRISLSDKKKELAEKEKVKNDLSKKRTIKDVFKYMISGNKGYHYKSTELIEIITSSKIYEKYKKFPIFKTRRILSPSDYAKVFATIKQPEIHDSIAINYLRSLERILEEDNRSDFIDSSFIEERFKKKKDGKMRTLTKEERTKLIYNKLSQMEMLYYLGCDKSLVKKWIKNAVIVGMYGIASSSGIIIMNGRHFKLNQFGKSAIKRRNSMYVKIGL